MAFSDDIIDAIWEKARRVEGYNSDLYRKDVCGAWIMKDAYGDRENNYGWEIDHVFPESRGGGDDEINLRAMHYKNNAAKGDNYPVYFSAVSSVENRNVEVRKEFTVNASLRGVLDNLYKK